MSDREGDKMRPRESVVEDRETKRESSSTSSTANSGMNGWKLKKNGCQSTVVLGSQGGLKLSDVSKSVHSSQHWWGRTEDR